VTASERMLEQNAIFLRLKWHSNEQNAENSKLQLEISKLRTEMNTLGETIASRQTEFITLEARCKAHE
jgi:hypothetical protein